MFLCRDARPPVALRGPQNSHKQKDGTDWNLGIHQNGAYVQFLHTKDHSAVGWHAEVQRESEPSFGFTFLWRYCYIKLQIFLAHLHICIIVWIF